MSNFHTTLFKIVLYCCLYRNTRNKYIPIPFCHHLYLSATFKQCFTEFEVTELSFHIAYM
jgi:hypothetical protein